MKNCIFVVGMHRSGTSCLAGMLRRCGVEFGAVQEHSLGNPLGNQEIPGVWALNDAVLAENGGGWDNPVVVSHWQESHRRERDAILQSLRDAGAAAFHQLWGLKDPRTLFMLPFWLEAMPEPRFIGTFRHPQQVALSLNARNAMPIEEGLQLWASYNQKLLDLLRDRPFPLVNFDLPPGAYLKDADEKFLMLGLDLQHSAQAREFFRPELAKQADANVEATRLPGEVAGLYQQLKRHHGKFTITPYILKARRWIVKIHAQLRNRPLYPPPPPGEG